METMQAIFSRRSIRKFTGQYVPDEAINDILKAAMYAPSANNQMPWHFIVIRDRKILDSIPNVHEYSHMCKEVNAAIVVCADLDLEKNNGCWVQDCAAAAQNILIAATDKKLGSVWLGVYPQEERVKGLKDLLKMPENTVPFCIIPIGFPSEIKVLPERFNRTKIHNDKW
jgi:nitroreductase